MNRSTWDEIVGAPGFPGQCIAVAEHLRRMIVDSSPEPAEVAEYLAGRDSLHLDLEPDGQGVVVSWFAGTRFFVTQTSFLAGATVEAVDTMDSLFGQDPGSMDGPDT